MKYHNPKREAIVSWIILGTGAMLAVIGAVTAKEYSVNLCLVAGTFVIVWGIIYHFIRVRCPYCGHSLVGYRPVPEECPNCHRKFEK